MNMKKSLFLLLISMILSFCQDCDGEYYQIKNKVILDKIRCQYTAQSIGDCLSWQDQTEIVFIDSCNVYNLSLIIHKDKLKKYK